MKDGLKQEISGMGTSLRQEMSEMKDGLKQEISGMGTNLRQEISEMSTDLQEQIRHNGVLLEALRDDVTTIAEVVSNLNHDMTQVKGDVAEIKETIHDYPILRETVKKHSRLLAKMQ
ncbi:MAG: hypothetical protein HY982_01840, partial [Candidatus Magasanikbacteria bacterium]|nr:hypothetical protein [Candidatus Magasanikbacteria bacterium]